MRGWEILRDLLRLHLHKDVHTHKSKHEGCVFAPGCPPLLPHTRADISPRARRTLDPPLRVCAWLRVSDRGKSTGPRPKVPSLSGIGAGWRVLKRGTAARYHFPFPVLSPGTPSVTQSPVSPQFLWVRPPRLRMSDAPVPDLPHHPRSTASRPRSHRRASPARTRPSPDRRGMDRKPPRTTTPDPRPTRDAGVPN